MAERKVVICFDDATVGEANVYADELGRELKDIEPSIETQKRQSKPGSQDFGSTLIVLFGTKFAFELAKGVASYLRRNSGAKITIEADGRVVAEHLNSRDAARIAEAFGRKSREA